MKNYDLLTTKIGDKKICIVFSTNVISPLKAVNDIQSECQSAIKDITDIYFDFLLCSHNSKKRYAKVECNNGKIDMTRFSFVNIPKKDSIRKISTDYYKSHANFLDWTCVSSIKKKLISNGVVI